MKHLIIIRHGDAKRDDVTLTDAQRPLAQTGCRQADAAAVDFFERGLSFDAIVSSSAKRALQTAEVWMKALKIPAERLQVEPSIYEAEHIDLLRIVQQLDDANLTVALIGHNPGVTGLLHHLVGRGIDNMGTSAYAVIAIDVDQWSRMALRHCQLVHYYTPPADVKEIGLWQRFVFWRRQRGQKVELFMVFLIALLLVLGGVIAIFTL